MKYFGWCTMQYLWYYILRWIGIDYALVIWFDLLVDVILIGMYHTWN
jgi:hypothetical protein